MEHGPHSRGYRRDRPRAKRRDALKGLEAKVGKVLNIHGGTAHAPVVINAYTALQGVISDHGTFDAATGEALALVVVGNVDQCTYCQSAHTASTEQAGFSQDQTVAIRAGRVDLGDKLGALLSLVRESASNLGHVEDETWQTALDARWTDTEHFNHLVETDLDVPAAPSL